MPESSGGENGHLVRGIFGRCAYFGAFGGGNTGALALREHGCDFVHCDCFVRVYGIIVTECECSGCVKSCCEQDGWDAQAEY